MMRRPLAAAQWRRALLPRRTSAAAASPALAAVFAAAKPALFSTTRQTQRTGAAPAPAEGDNGDADAPGRPLLIHHHLEAKRGDLGGYIPYDRAVSWQETLRARMLEWRALADRAEAEVREAALEAAVEEEWEGGRLGGRGEAGVLVGEEDVAAEVEGRQMEGEGGSEMADTPLDDTATATETAIAATATTAIAATATTAPSISPSKLAAAALALEWVPEAPRPRLITFECAPTFTLGRRQEAPDAAQAERLHRPLTVRRPIPASTTTTTTDSKDDSISKKNREEQSPGAKGKEKEDEKKRNKKEKIKKEKKPTLTLRPEVCQTSRGGLTTYHGPGQLVLWPVLDMRSPLYPRLGVAAYAALLEATTRRVLGEMGVRTRAGGDEPGVWVVSAPSGSSASASDSTAGSAGDTVGEGEEGRERKIAALGVHHRRHVTALGMSINVDVPVEGGEEVNPWARFVPCGLVGREVTSVAAELARARARGEGRGEMWDMARIAERWKVLFEEGLRDPEKRVFREEGEEDVVDG